MNKNENSAALLFKSNNMNNGDSQENDIESKLQKRNEDFANEENFSKIKESAMRIILRRQKRKLPIPFVYRKRRFSSPLVVRSRIIWQS